MHLSPNGRAFSGPPHKCHPSAPLSRLKQMPNIYRQYWSQVQPCSSDVLVFVFFFNPTLFSWHFILIPFPKKVLPAGAVEYKPAHLWSSTERKIRETLNVIFCHINLFIYLIMVNLMETTCFWQERLYNTLFFFFRILHIFAISCMKWTSSVKKKK